MGRMVTRPFSSVTRISGDAPMLHVHSQVRDFEPIRGCWRGGAASLDLAYIACGRLDGYWERGLSPWDIAAGIVLVEEAGGQVSAYAGCEGAAVVAFSALQRRCLMDLVAAYLADVPEIGILLARFAVPPPVRSGSPTRS